MTFARVTGCQEMDEHGPLYATPAGVSTETLRGRFVCNLAALTVVATGEYDAHTMPFEPEGMMVSEPDPSAVGNAGLPRERHGRCPTCARLTSWRDNPQRPFCSLACRLIDLGVWLDERYVVPGEPPDDVR